MAPRVLISSLLAVSLALSAPLACYAQTEIMPIHPDGQVYVSVDLAHDDQSSNDAVIHPLAGGKDEHSNVFANMPVSVDSDSLYATSDDSSTGNIDSAGELGSEYTDVYSADADANQSEGINALSNNDSASGGFGGGISSEGGGFGGAFSGGNRVGGASIDDDEGYVTYGEDLLTDNNQIGIIGWYLMRNQETIINQINNLQGYTYKSKIIISNIDKNLVVINDNINNLAEILYWIGKNVYTAVNNQVVLERRLLELKNNLGSGSSSNTDVINAIGQLKTSLLDSIVNLGGILEGGNLSFKIGGSDDDFLAKLLLQSNPRAYEHSIYGFLETIHEWTEEYQTTLFNNVSRYLYEANDNESTTLTAYARMIYTLLKGREFSISDELMAKLDALYDAISSYEPPQYGSNDLTGINARLDAIIGLLAADAAIDLVDALLGNLDFAAMGASLGTLGQTLSSAFPFCLIFAIVAALGALSAEPVTPSFDFDVPIGLNGEVYSLAVNLADFDGLAVLVRYVLLVAYCIGLFMVTKDHIYNPSGGE